MPVAPTDKDRPRRRRRTRAPSTTDRTSPSLRRAAPKKGPPTPRPAPRPSGPSFAEPFRKPHGLERQTVKARDRTRRAERRLPDNPIVPHVPLKSDGYDPRERAAVQRIYRTAAKRAGLGSVEELYRQASPAQRQQIRRVGRVVMFGPEAARDPLGLIRIRERNRRDVVRAGELRPKLNLEKILTAGPNVAFQPKQAKMFGATGAQVARAAYESPGRVAGTSIRAARESITGIPQGIKALADDPVKAVDMIVKDYEDRYGSALKDPKAFRERVKDEWGLTPYVFDAAAAAGGGGQALGALATSTRFGRAAAALERARVPGAGVARRVHETMASERPALRFSGGEEGVRPQTRSRNLFVGLGQSRLDRSRAKALGERTGAHRARALDREVRAGEVTPKTSGVIGRSLRESRATRAFTGRVARDVGGAQSKSRLRLLTHQGRTVGRMRDRIKKLSKQERVAVREMAALGVRADADGLKALRTRLGQIDPDSPDAAAIRTILKDPDAHLTPEAGEIVDELRDIQIENAARDPRLPVATEQLRRLGEQAKLLGLERGPNVERFLAKVRKIEEDAGITGLEQLAMNVARALPKDRPALAKKLARRIEKEASQAERDVQTAARRLARSQGRADVLGSTARTGKRGEGAFAGDTDLEAAWGSVAGKPNDVATKIRETETGRRASVERYDADGKLVGRLAFDVGEDGLPTNVDVVVHSAHRGKGIATQLYNAARAEGFDMRRSVAGVRSEAGEAFRRSYGAEEVQHRQLQLAARKETRDHLQKFGKATRKVHKKAKAGAKKFDPRDLEDHAQFAERIRTAADQAGLAEPAYWKGIIEGDLGEAPSNYAVGGGMRATAKPRRTEYKLTEQGRGERDPEVLVRGVEANIKRRFQYQLVARNIEVHAFPWSKNEGRGMTIDQIRFHARENGIDPDSIHIQDTRIINRAGEGDVPGDLADDLTSDAMNVTSLKDVTSRDYKDLAQNRYLAMPAEVGETLNTAARALDSKVFRALEVILKQKPARIMLGAFNVPWLGFQVASNAMLTGLGGGVNPFDIFGAHKWWKGLDADARDAIEAELGITHGHHFGMDQPHLGAVNSRYVAAWRGFKQTKAMRLGHRMNPLDAMFRADEAQNNFFRRTLFYSKARKAAYRRMGSNWRGTARGMDRLMERVLAKPPDRLPQAIATHGHEFERTAKHVKDFLGDYMSFTPAERFLLSRNVMFYGYLRFSLRFAFYTMPVGHPVMTAMMTDIGRMGAQEIKELFGVPRGYNLPASMGAQVYFGDRADAKKGTLRSINFGRMNPFLNAVTQMEDGNQSLGLVSPLYQAVADQFFEESSFTGRDWRVRGQPTPSEAERPRNYYTMEDRGRIGLRSVLKLGFPYRVAEELALEPSQSDDALAWSPRPLMYKDEEAMAGVAKSRRLWRQEGAQRHVGEGLFPVFPKVTAAPQVIERELEKEAANEDRKTGKKHKRRRKSKRYSGSSGSRYGSSGSRYGG